MRRCLSFQRNHDTLHVNNSAPTCSHPLYCQNSQMVISGDFIIYILPYIHTYTQTHTQTHIHAHIHDIHTYTFIMYTQLHTRDIETYMTYTHR